MANVYYVDGKFVPDSEAAFPINDLGLLRGYGCFDFMRTYNGQVIFIKDHVHRLFRSALQIGIDLPFSETELIHLVEETLKRNPPVESNEGILVTGGSSPDFITPQGRPRIAIMVASLSQYPAAWYAEGAKIITVAHTRTIPGAARIHLDARLVEAGLPSREEYRDDVFEFAVNGGRAALRQALTDTIRWSLETRADVVVIEIAPVSGGTVRLLILKPSPVEHRLFVGNLPVHDAQAHDQLAMSDEALAVLHVGAYYELLRRVPDARPMPRRLAPHARRATGLWAGPFCPPAIFRAN